MRVITLTPAPAIDRTYQLASFAVGDVHRALGVRSELAGKGVNVSRGLAVGGVSSLAVVPLSSADVPSVSGDPMIHPSPIDAPLRVNITVVEEGGRTTKINEIPPALSHPEWSALVTSTLDLAHQHEAEWILLAGTIPRHTDGSEIVAGPLFEEAHSRGIHMGLDTSGSALASLARSGYPDFIKPNAPELAECVGRSLHTLGDVVDAAIEVKGWGVTNVLVSLGADGMVGVSDRGTVHASSGPVSVRNTIGAGDASVAGFLSHLVSHPTDFAGAVGMGVAWGAQKGQEVISHLQNLDGLPAAAVTENPDRSRVLEEQGVV